MQEAKVDVSLWVQGWSQTCFYIASWGQPEIYNETLYQKKSAMEMQMTKLVSKVKWLIPLALIYRSFNK